MTKKSTKTNKPSEKTSIDKEIVDDNFEIERFASVINPTKEILDLLRKSSGLTAKAIAEQHDAHRNDINKLLYGNLKGQVWQDNNYEWRIKDSSSTSIKIGKEKNFCPT